jgi:hypothetical protein
MKRALAAAAMAAPLALVPGVALAGGSTGGSSSASIHQYADYNFAGTQLDVGLDISCKGGTAVVDVTVEQYFPETPDPLGAYGTGVQNVVCDGKTRYVGVTVVGVVYDAGKAKATATLVAPSGTKTASRWISVQVR